MYMNREVYRYINREIYRYINREIGIYYIYKQRARQIYE